MPDISSVTGFSLAAGGGTSLLNLALGDPIDLTDGSWTLTDPNNFVKSVSFSTPNNLVTWNAVASGSNNYTWTAGATKSAPRWHKTLQIDSTTLTTDNLILLMSMLQIDTSVDDFAQQIVVGAAEDPTSSTASVILGGGGGAEKLLSGNDRYGVWTNSSASLGGAAAAVKGFSAYLYGTRSTGTGSALILNSSGYRDNNASRNGGLALASSTNLSVMVGVGTRGTVTVADGDQQQFSIYFLPISITQP
jgi:hypothetical protein